ncbi:hypothetical protein EG328_003161 [Venturia inaequalis]|uniref:FAM192A/Fyv6 N-terminal domain-containing protein n=1 Tax=Venturia inaequalis TaxID=5025 RepID=A0A8H3UU15_VENIN|nr:hypothetical protein EG328_003161 [Venturia inaequalis]KAE9989774.1 hypothetical protein EG327_002241 [Venturia inaequalis]
MSSGFVSGGSLEKPAERDDAWKKAQEELEARRKSKEDANQASNGKSLFETLQANKVAKEEAFAEANRLKNQFRAIDEDEADFLESVLESTRAQEDAIRKETAESLAAFRKQQEEKEKAALGLGDSGNLVDGEETWTFSGKKRKKGKPKEFLKGIKLRKTSSTDSPSETLVKTTASVPPTTETKDPIHPKASSPVTTTSTTSTKKEAPSVAPRKPSTSPIIALGLGNYSSDEDD